MSEPATEFWEPWRLGRLLADGTFSIEDSADTEEIGLRLGVTCMDEPIAERIVLCVNACRGVANVDLTEGFAAELIAANDVLNSQLISEMAESGRLREALEAAREVTK